MKEEIAKFMREQWVPFLADQQEMLWDWDRDVNSTYTDDNMTWDVAREFVDEYLENVEENQEVVLLHMIIWKLIDWQTVADEAVKLAEIQRKKKEVK